MPKAAAKEAEQLPAILRRLRRKRCILTFHSLGDADAAGAAIALKRHLGSNCTIAPPDKPSSSARRLLEATHSSITMFHELKFSGNEAVVALDSASPYLMRHLAGTTPDLIIDHHARLGGEIKAKAEINDPSASSTCEILALSLLPKDKISCISLLAGIIADSAGFKYATHKTFQAASFLLKNSGLGYGSILSLSFAPETLGERIESLRSCQTVSAERIGEYIVATATAKSHESHFADALIHLGADLAFVGCKGEDGRISARMRESLKGKVHLGEIMAEAGKALEGSGSGHELAAGASGKRESLESAMSVCLKLSEQQILSSESGKIRKIEW
ncbi:MAG: DHHA1 domain-containing protein [Candidatus Micrarchaeota archaeon]|nr:DHHA1 domain-containing protein [Candidatus Micrarchaeota archaeon]